MFGKKVKMIGKLTALFCCTALLAGCGQENKTENGEKAEYVSITPKEAKEIMDSDAGYIILDVRTQEEYDAGHIPGAVLIPDYEIADRAAAELTDREQIILVYCRSGRRSKNASAELAEMGYGNVKEFGGIIDWPYETEQ